MEMLVLNGLDGAPETRSVVWAARRKSIHKCAECGRTFRRREHCVRHERGRRYHGISCACCPSDAIDQIETSGPIRAISVAVSLLVSEYLCLPYLKWHTHPHPSWIDRMRPFQDSKVALEVLLAPPEVVPSTWVNEIEAAELCPDGSRFAPGLPSRAE